MKRLSIFLLAFLTFWMSTWMVTDIHGWSIADDANQPHPVFSVQQVQVVSDLPATTEDHKPDCGVCSYDHGGHMGQTLAAISFVESFIPVQREPIPLHSKFWSSRYTTPKIRPPIV